MGILRLNARGRGVNGILRLWGVCARGVMTGTQAIGDWAISYKAGDAPLRSWSYAVYGK